MAHIVDCIADAESGTTSKLALLGPPYDSRTSTVTPDFQQPYAWRMQPQALPSQPKRYNLFPKERQLPVLNSNKDSDLARNPELSNGQQEERLEKSTVASALKNKISQHSITRRRKVSVPDLGPMTTVQEVSMDSPTIPGRPPLHERSASAPADDGRQNSSGGFESFLLVDADEHDQYISANATGDLSVKRHNPPFSKQLAPLVIPQSATTKAPQLLLNRPITHARSGSVPTDHSKTSCSQSAEAPQLRKPCFPSASATDLNGLYMSSNNAFSSLSLNTPISAPVSDSHRFSPRPWEGRSMTPTMLGRSMTPQPVGTQRAITPQGHRRDGSDSSNIMDRGRPRKRADTRRNQGAPGKRCGTPSEEQSERKAFEELPSGWRPKEAAAKLQHNEIKPLHEQARSQAERFEVLNKADVEALSKELRRLDERTEYLRRTYTSLRAGRRNLQSRICQFLRSPRTAKFNQDAMLRQEEALAELDTSIDDWVNKLDMAENRRTRVRQKLLEHIAAAAILDVPEGTPTPSDVLQQAPGLHQLHDISTPPRSPTKHTQFCTRPASSSPSPQRVVAQVPSTILEQPIIEEAETQKEKPTLAPAVSLRRADVESIRIYAGDDIATLLMDVENEISRISQEIIDPAKSRGPLNLEPRTFKKRQSNDFSGSWPEPRTLETHVERDHGDDDLESPPPPPPPAKDYPPRFNAASGRTTPSRAVWA